MRVYFNLNVMLELAVSGRMPTSVTQDMLQKACRAAIRLAKKSDSGFVSISFVTDRVMQGLNKQYRKKDKTTDVLSFSEPEVPGQRHSWGDIFVSPAYVRDEARRRGISVQEEILRVVVHGMFHLMGYDHATEETELEMFTLQEKALAKIEIV